MKIKKGYIIPNCLELRKSPLHGLGYFATEFIPEGTDLGICHYFDYHNQEGKIVNLRTPIVGFFNYDENPNAILRQERPSPRWKHAHSMHNRLFTRRDIQKGEEILLKYSWYDPTKPNTETNKHYIPLPECVSIEKRNGVYVLYALENINMGFDFGVSHYRYTPSGMFEPNPIGGFLVESNKPNCKLIKQETDLSLTSILKINKGETISVNYEKI